MESEGASSSGVKNELRQKIQNRRRRAGKDDLKVEVNDESYEVRKFSINSIWSSANVSIIQQRVFDPFGEIVKKCFLCTVCIVICSAWCVTCRESLSHFFTIFWKLLKNYFELSHARLIDAISVT